MCDPFQLRFVCLTAAEEAFVRKSELNTGSHADGKMIWVYA